MPSSLSGGFSTSALAIGTAAPPKQEIKPAAITPTTTPAPEPLAEKTLDKPVAPPIVSSGLPAAIESAVKAATETAEPSPPKAEMTSAPSPTKPEVKAELKSEAKLADKTARPIVETIVTPAQPATKDTAQPTAKDTTEKPSPASLRRQRAESRQAQIEGKKEGDWLQNHGKVIAVGFVLALIATIYLARRNRGTPAPPPSIDTPNLAVEIPGDKPDPARPVEAANTAPRLVEAPSHPLDTTPSPATPVDAAPAASTAELQPPVVPSAGQTTAPPTSEPLFPWQNDSRVATRPEEAKIPAASTPNNSAPASNGQTTVPALNAPTYPETNLRDAPLLPPAPPATPNSAPTTGTPGNNPGPGAGQGGSRVPRSFSPASFTSAPGGNRYERTGSGLY
jgi:hypothetical protein